MREFFGCYLLVSKSQQNKGRTYIGFTVNPRRRIRQHNGIISAGAWKTSRGRPWDMTMVLYGFPTKIQALQFEWAWQHPEKSIIVRPIVAALGAKKLVGVRGKILLMLNMLHESPWRHFPLTLQYLHEDYASLVKESVASAPLHVRVCTAPMDELPRALNDMDEEGGEEEEQEERGGKRKDRRAKRSGSKAEEAHNTVAAPEDGPVGEVEAHGGSAGESDSGGGESGREGSDGVEGATSGSSSDVEDGLGGLTLAQRLATLREGPKAGKTSLPSASCAAQDQAAPEPQLPAPHEPAQASEHAAAVAAAAAAGNTRLRCNICQGQIPRHILVCTACGVTYHLDCLASHWSSAAAVGGAGGADRHRFGGVPESGHCPACSHEHTWMGMLQAMQTVGWGNKPRGRKGRAKKVAAAAAGSGEPPEQAATSAEAAVPAARGRKKATKGKGVEADAGDATTAAAVTAPAPKPRGRPRAAAPSEPDPAAAEAAPDVADTAAKQAAPKQPGRKPRAAAVGGVAAKPRRKAAAASAGAEVAHAAVAADLEAGGGPCGQDGPTTTGSEHPTAGGSQRGVSRAAGRVRPAKAKAAATAQDAPHDQQNELLPVPWEPGGPRVARPGSPEAPPPSVAAEPHESPSKRRRQGQCPLVLPRGDEAAAAGQGPQDQAPRHGSDAEVEEASPLPLWRRLQARSAAGAAQPQDPQGRVGRAGQGFAAPHALRPSPHCSFVDSEPDLPLAASAAWNAAEWSAAEPVAAHQALRSAAAAPLAAADTCGQQQQRRRRSPQPPSHASEVFIIGTSSEGSDGASSASEGEAGLARPGSSRLMGGGLPAEDNTREQGGRSLPDPMDFAAPSPAPATSLPRARREESSPTDACPMDSSPSQPLGRGSPAAHVSLEASWQRHPSSLARAFGSPAAAAAESPPASRLGTASDGGSAGGGITAGIAQLACGPASRTTCPVEEGAQVPGHGVDAAPAREGHARQACEPDALPAADGGLHAAGLDPDEAGPSADKGLFGGFWQLQTAGSEQEQPQRLQPGPDGVGPVVGTLVLTPGKAAGPAPSHAGPPAGPPAYVDGGPPSPDVIDLCSPLPPPLQQRLAALAAAARVAEPASQPVGGRAEAEAPAVASPSEQPRHGLVAAGADQHCRTSAVLRPVNAGSASSGPGLGADYAAFGGSKRLRSPKPGAAAAEGDGPAQGASHSQGRPASSMEALGSVPYPGPGLDGAAPEGQMPGGGWSVSPWPIRRKHRSSVEVEDVEAVGAHSEGDRADGASDAPGIDAVEVVVQGVGGGGAGEAGVPAQAVHGDEGMTAGSEDDDVIIID